MSSEATNPKPGRKAKTLDEEIAAQCEKLQKLGERQWEQQHKKRECNQKVVMELIETERLDVVPSDLWREAMPKIKTLLVVNAAKSAEPVTPVQTTPEIAVTAEASQWALSTNLQAPVPSTGNTQIFQRERVAPGFPQEAPYGKLEKHESLWGLWET